MGSLPKTPFPLGNGLLLSFVAALSLCACHDSIPAETAYLNKMDVALYLYGDHLPDAPEMRAMGNFRKISDMDTNHRYIWAAMWCDGVDGKKLGDGFFDDVYRLLETKKNTAFYFVRANAAFFAGSPFEKYANVADPLFTLCFRNDFSFGVGGFDSYFTDINRFGKSEEEMALNALSACNADIKAMAGSV